MKALKYLIILQVLFSGCSNKEISFPDYIYNTVYFPLQYPLRTLILGDSRSDNSLDKMHQFNIGVSIGGVYENKIDRTVDYMVDESLVPANLTQADGSSLEVLPESYYSLSPKGSVVIPAGSFNGLIRVQLADAFFEDPLTAGSHYVIPLRITGTSADSILSGLPAVPNPNRNAPEDWDAGAPPKDYVLFGIKYINPFHGTYLHRGKDVAVDDDGNPISSVVYHEKYVEDDQLWQLTTTGMTTVETNGVGFRFTDISKMRLDIGPDGNITISPVATSNFKANGTGTYVKDAEPWGGMNHPAMYLNYSYGAGGIRHEVTDTLVFRDNSVVFEEIKVVLN